jgi:iron complex outermembrane receptor protein
MGKMSRTRCSTTRLGLAVAIAASAWSASAAPVTTNAPIVVTASRADRTAEELPAQVTVITAEDINKSGAQNVVSALESLGGLYFRHNSDNPGQADISMRGFGQNSHGRVLVLVDGQRLNTADMATLDWLRIPVSSVERIEVLRGGQTALYGNYAVAGVINIITRQPTKVPVTTVSVTAGSDNTLGGHVGHAGTVGATRYTADADWLQSDGWRDHSGYDNTDVRATLAHDWCERFTSTMSAFYTENNYDMPGYLTRGQLADDPKQSLPANGQWRTTSQTFGGGLGARGELDADQRVESDFTASHRTIASDMPSTYAPMFTDTSLDSYTLTPRYISEADLTGHRNRFLAGVDLGLEQYEMQGYSDKARTLQKKDGTLDRTDAAAYVQNEFWLTRELSLVLGARGDVCQYASTVATNLPFTPGATSAERTYQESAVDAALVYRPFDNLKLYARFATLYRDPFVDEMAILDQSYASTNGPISTSLQPETGRQFEIGGTLTLAKEWTLDVSAYRLDMRDEIAWRADEGSYTTGYNANQDETRRYGVDTALTWARQKVGLVSAAYNYVDARFSAGDYANNQIPLVPAHVLTLRGELDLPCNFTALATLHTVSSQYSGGDEGNGMAKLASYGTVDLGLRYQPTSLAGFDLTFGVDNVCDQIYANSGYYAYAYYPAPGRTWKTTATYRF